MDVTLYHKFMYYLYLTETPNRKACVYNVMLRYLSTKKMCVNELSDSLLKLRKGIYKEKKQNYSLYTTFIIHVAVFACMMKVVKLICV